MAPAPVQPARAAQLVRGGGARTRARHGAHRVLCARHDPRDRARRTALAARRALVRPGDEPRCAVYGRVCRAVRCDELFLVGFVRLGRLCVVFFFFHPLGLSVKIDSDFCCRYQLSLVSWIFWLFFLTT